MNVDILEKLIPNILTMITQLAATGVIFIMYKKYLHSPVMDYLDAREEAREKELQEAEASKKEAKYLQDKTKLEYEEAHREIASLRDNMLSEARLEKEKIIESAKVEIQQLKDRNDQILKSERERLYEEVNAHLLEVASDINQKVLSDYSFNEDEMLDALQKEMVNHDYQH